MAHFDAIVLGTGGVGSAALYHLAKRGVRALGIDRFPPGHDRGSSHGATRIIRQAYFEHPDYTPLLLRAYELWAELSERCRQLLFQETGLLQVGPPKGEVVSGVVACARQHQLEIEELTGREISARWPGFRVAEASSGVFEKRAGYLAVEACVQAHLSEACKAGAELLTPCTALDWQTSGSGVVVSTDRGEFSAGALIVTAGPWAGQLLNDLGLRLEVRRKPVFWFEAIETAYSAARGCPCFLFELPGGIFYGMPQIDATGVKVAEHTGGAVVADPLQLKREAEGAERRRVEEFLAACLPQVSRRQTRHSVCMYTMSPDGQFIVDRHPSHQGVVFAAGLSGHGFKFTGVLGEALAELALQGETQAPVGFLALSRSGLRD
ncbi:MAG TPA: N-methyl-L-tryptophan oxidase [Pirellulales bacterium]|nr:N-methyl-L-tryptophan oxidase [Pirellulales bacterium]